MSILMLEPIGNKPIRLVGEGLDAAIVLIPGKPQQVEAGIGEKLLQQCGQSIRISRAQWLEAWQELANLTSGILENDSRFKPILAALDICDEAFVREDWSAFQRGVEEIQQHTE